MRILVVEDDPLVAHGVKQGLERAGFTVDHVSSAELAEELLKRDGCDLAVVDIGLPRMDGLELVRRLRNQQISIPILVLTARDRLEDCVDGLDRGADDYMTKPFRLPELVARARALIRRSHSLADSRLTLGPLTLDPARHAATLCGTDLDLTGREWSILESLLIHAPNVVSKDRLVHSLGGWSSDLTPNAVEVYISRLRAKLAPGRIEIRTVRGIGYRLDEPGGH